MGFLIPFWVEVIGVFAWVPQIQRVWSEKKHDGISLPTFTLVSTSLVLWLVYGIVIGSVAMTLANVAALCCIITIIVGVVKLRNIQ